MEYFQGMSYFYTLHFYPLLFVVWQLNHNSASKKKSCHVFLERIYTNKWQLSHHSLCHMHSCCCYHTSLPLYHQASLNLLCIFQCSSIKTSLNRCHFWPASAKQALQGSASLNCHKMLPGLTHYKSSFQLIYGQRLVSHMVFITYMLKKMHIHTYLPCSHMPSHVRALQQPMHFSTYTLHV